MARNFDATALDPMMAGCAPTCPPPGPGPKSAIITPIVSVSSVNGESGDIVLKYLTIGEKEYNGSNEVRVCAKDLGLAKAFKYEKAVATKERVLEYLADAEVGEVYFCNEDKLFYLSVGEGDHKVFVSKSALINYLENFAKIEEAGGTLDLSVDETTYELTATLKAIDGSVLSTSTVDLPIEHLVREVKYDPVQKAIIITWQNGTVTVIPVSDLVGDLATKAELGVVDLKVENHIADALAHITTAERTLWNSKQDALIAGSNITIDNNRISAQDTVYTAGEHITIGSDNKISADFYDDTEVRSLIAGKQGKLTAGENITIDENNKISARVQAAVNTVNGKVGDVTLTAADVNALPVGYHDDSKQNRLTAGANITIDEENRISAVDTVYDDTEVRALINEKYTKPEAGVPLSDLAVGIQQSLAKADTAIQEHQSLAGYATQVWVEGKGYSIVAETGNKLNLDYASATGVLTVKLLDKNNNTLDTKEVDLPTEKLIISGRYDATKKAIILELQSGATIEIPVGDLVDGLVSQAVFNAHANNADIHITASERTIWNAKADKTYVDTELATKYIKPATGVPKTDLAADVQQSLAKADSAIQAHQDISGKQDKLTAGENITISADNKISATDTVYDDTDVRNEIIRVEALANAKYVKPTEGIPTSDLTQGIRDSLAKADSALQEHQSLAGYATETWVEGKGYLTQHQDISGKADKTYVDTEVAKKQDILTAGTNVQINNNVISATDTVYDDTEVRGLINNKQDKLTAGENITIENNVISSTASSKLATALTATVTVGGVNAGDMFAAGTSFEEIIRQILAPAKTLTGITITTAPTKTEYLVGETFDKTGMVVQASYNIGSPAEVTDYTFTPSGALAETDTKVTISYTEGGVTKTAEQAITVKKPEVLLYQGPCNNIPTDLTGLTKISGKTAAELKATPLIQTISASIDPETEMGQYVVLAAGNEVTLTKWENEQFPGEMEFNTVDKGTYKLYYLTGRVTEPISYKFTFS